MGDMHMVFSIAALVKVADAVEQEKKIGGHVQVAAPKSLQCIWKVDERESSVVY
jgi:hypothetical protein